MPTRVLIVEDEPIQAEDMASTLERKGYSVCGVVSTTDDAERIALAERPEVIIMDLRLIGPKSGADLAAALRRKYKFGLIFVTGNVSSYEALESMRALKPDAIMAKPIDGQVLLTAVMRASRAAE